MIKTLHPYTNTAKTAEIMSRYRPIAPKPETPENSMTEGSSLSQKMKQSPYLRSLWPQLQARPTRTRKRGRASLPLPSLKRHKTLSLRTYPQFPLPNHGLLNSSWEKPCTTPMTLPLLPCEFDSAGTEEVIDLNLNGTRGEIPEEKDLLQQLLQRPSISINVIAPQPIRPVGSRISVGCVSEDPSLSLPPTGETPKTTEEVEEEVECEALPAVITDSNNQVRMANSAYEEMVGQPECAWLHSVVTSSDGRIPRGRGGGSCKRISGEVTLRVCDSTIPISSNGFSCWVRIDWKTTHNKSTSINAFCDVIRLCCESRHYLFKWRFHTPSCTKQASQSNSNV